MEQSYTIIGLVLNFVGAICLAYDLLWGYPKRNRRLIAENQLANLESFFAQIDRTIDRWGEPPYTKEEKEHEKYLVRKEREPQIEKLKSIVYAGSDGHKEKAYFVALSGAIFLAAGFAFQLADVL